MIIGIGTDIVDIKRIGNAIEKHRGFCDKILSQEEFQMSINDKNFVQYVAGRFAAKEAISKAMGTGIRGFKFKDIVIVNDEYGAPRVRLQGKAHEIANLRGKYNIHLSISHERMYAIAYAIMEVV